MSSVRSDLRDFLASGPVEIARCGSRALAAVLACSLATGAMEARAGEGEARRALAAEAARELVPGRALFVLPVETAVGGDVDARSLLDDLRAQGGRFGAEVSTALSVLPGMLKDNGEGFAFRYGGAGLDGCIAAYSTAIDIDAQRVAYTGIPAAAGSEALSRITPASMKAFTAAHEFEGHCLDDQYPIASSLRRPVLHRLEMRADTVAAMVLMKRAADPAATADFLRQVAVVRDAGTVHRARVTVVPEHGSGTLPLLTP